MKKKTYLCKAQKCRNRFERVFSSTQQVCSPQCANQYAIAKREKAEKLQAKQTRKEKRDLDRKSLAWQHKQTQPAFNKMRVLEEMMWFDINGLEPTCISCNKPSMDWCCGHFKTRGAQPALRYDRKNTYLQCNTYCNKHLSGNIEGNKNTRGLKQGLRDRFGEDAAAEIIEYCDTNTESKDWSWRDLEALREGFSKRIRQLKKLRSENHEHRRSESITRRYATQGY